MSYDWETLISDWPVEACHPLVDCPGEFCEEYRSFCRVDQFVREDWYKGLLASTVFGRAAFWQHQYLKWSEMSSWTSATEIVIGSCRGDFVYSVVLTVEKAMSLMLLCSRNVGIVSRICGTTVAVPKVYLPSVPEPIYVFFCLTGPSESDVKTFEGKVTTVTDVVTDVSCTWYICSAPRSRVEVKVPSSLSVMWLRKSYAQRKPDYMDGAFYLRQMTSYTLWSFGLHYRQLEEVLRPLPPSSVLVAPGDGIGLVARLWKGQVISGDFSRNPLTSQIVATESFSVTMDRGMKIEGSVLVLSYVFSLLSSSEQLRAIHWPGPIIVVDNRDISPGPQFEHVGPGIFVSGFSASITLSTDYVPASKQLFSENLLALESISFIERNPSVHYWNTLRPLGSCKSRVKSSDVLVVHSLPELARYVSDKQAVSGCYLTSIGRYFDGVVPIFVDINTEFDCRVVYEVCASHPCVDYVKHYAHWAVCGNMFWFTFLKPCVVLRSLSSWIFSSTKEFKGGSPYACRLLTINESFAYVSCLRGSVKVDISDMERRYALLLYLEEYGHPSWKDVYASGSLLSRIGSRFVPVSLQYAQKCKKNLSPRCFPWNSFIGVFD